MPLRIQHHSLAVGSQLSGNFQRVWRNRPTRKNSELINGKNHSLRRTCCEVEINHCASSRALSRKRRVARRRRGEGYIETAKSTLETQPLKRNTNFVKALCISFGNALKNIAVRLKPLFPASSSTILLSMVRQHQVPAFGFRAMNAGCGEWRALIVMVWRASAGHRNSFMFSIYSLYRVISSKQYLWPIETSANPYNSNVTCFFQRENNILTANQ